MQANDFDTEVDQLTYEEPKLGIPKNNSVSHPLFGKQIAFSGKSASHLIAEFLAIYFLGNYNEDSMFS